MASLNVSIKDNIKEVTKKLTHLQKEQIPFATAKALTDTAWNARLFAQDGMVRDMEKPKAYTLNAFKVGKATKRSLVAYIDIKPIQWDYLKWVVAGGTKRAVNSPLTIPYLSSRMTKVRYTKLLARPDTFEGVVKGISGIWERIGRHRVKLLFAHEQQADYDKNSWKYQEDVERAVKARFPVNFNRSLEYALRSAKW